MLSATAYTLRSFSHLSESQNELLGKKKRPSGIFYKGIFFCRKIFVHKAKAEECRSCNKNFRFFFFGNGKNLIKIAVPGKLDKLVSFKKRTENCRCAQIEAERSMT